MNEGLIARRYAKALLKYAQEKDVTLPCMKPLGK